MMLNFFNQVRNAIPLQASSYPLPIFPRGFSTKRLSPQEMLLLSKKARRQQQELTRLIAPNSLPTNRVLDPVDDSDDDDDDDGDDRFEDDGDNDNEDEDEEMLTFLRKSAHDPFNLVQAARSRIATPSSHATPSPHPSNHLPHPHASSSKIPSSSSSSFSIHNNNNNNNNNSNMNSSSRTQDHPKKPGKRTDKSSGDPEEALPLDDLAEALSGVGGDDVGWLRSANPHQKTAANFFRHSDLPDSASPPLPDDPFYNRRLMHDEEAEAEAEEREGEGEDAFDFNDELARLFPSLDDEDFHDAGEGQQPPTPRSFREARQLPEKLQLLKEELRQARADDRQKKRKDKTSSSPPPPPNPLHPPGDAQHCGGVETAVLHGCEPCLHRLCLTDASLIAQRLSPLHLAASHDSPAMLQLLLIGPDAHPSPQAFAQAGLRSRNGDPRGGGGLPVPAYAVDVRDAKGATPLHWAAHHGSEKGALMLLLAGAKAGARDRLGITPLLVAAAEEAPRVMQLLVAHGASVEEEDGQGNRAAHVAAIGSRMESLLLLHRMGADLNARNAKGLAPIHLAVGEHEELHLLMLLLRLGADPMARGMHGYTPLHLAVAKGSVEMIGALLATERVDVNAVETEHGTTPLHAAAAIDDDELSFQCMALLLNPLAEGERPACLVPSLNARDGEGLTPLHVAAAKGNAKTLVLLMRMGAQVDVVSELGATPLHYAVSEVEAASFRLLLDLGRADPAVQDHAGATPLHTACQISDGPLRFSFVKALVEYHADLVARRAKAPLGRSGDACNNGGDGGGRVLASCPKELRAYVCLPDYEGHTALHIACAQEDGCLETVKVLVENGADVNAPAAARDAPIKVTPTEIALQREDEPVVEYLYEHGAVIDWQKIE